MDLWMSDPEKYRGLYLRDDLLDPPGPNGRTPDDDEERPG
jgi:hypothetical protein